MIQSQPGFSGLAMDSGVIIGAPAFAALLNSMTIIPLTAFVFRSLCVHSWSIIKTEKSPPRETETSAQFVRRS
jgi:hypothetical protein